MHRVLQRIPLYQCRTAGILYTPVSVRGARPPRATSKEINAATWSAPLARTTTTAESGS